MKDRFVAAARVVERMRDESYEKATVVRGDPKQTQIIRDTYRAKIKELCEKANLGHALDMTDKELWGRIWRKFQYTQVKAKLVNEKFLPSMEKIAAVHDPVALSGPEWAIEKVGSGNAATSYMASGPMAKAFLNGDLSDGRYHKASYRLYRLVNTARLFTRVQVLADRDSTNVLRWLDRQANGVATAGRPLANDAVSCTRALLIAENMRDELGTGFVTALHILMDIGMPVIKPDTWMIRLIDAMGFTTDGSDAEVVRIAAAIATHYRAWNLTNPLRELDFVMVKLAQAGGPTEGIVEPIETELSCPVTRRWMREELDRDS